MTLEEAIKTIQYERDELHKKQLAGHHTWATGVLAAAIELLPYAVEHQEWRYKFAGLAMQGIMTTGPNEEYSRIVRKSAQIADDLIAELRR